MSPSAGDDDEAFPPSNGTSSRMSSVATDEGKNTGPVQNQKFLQNSSPQEMVESLNTMLTYLGKLRVFSKLFLPAQADVSLEQRTIRTPSRTRAS